MNKKLFQMIKTISLIYNADQKQAAF